MLNIAKQRWWIGFLAVMLVASGPACTQDSGDASPSVEDEERPMKLTVVLGGDLSYRVERTVTTRVVLVEGVGDDIPPTFGVQPLEPIAVRTGGDAAMPGVAVLPFKGKGRYTIRAGGPGDRRSDATAPMLESSVRVEWWPADGEPYEYQRRVKPCTVDIEKNDGSKGRLRCAELTQEIGEGPHFSLDFRWEEP